jgi:2-oxoglutarate ferredoxin oxidoreductase subunit delta
MKKGYIKIKEERCKQCLYCIETCPKNLLKIGNDINNKGYHPVIFFDSNNKCNACQLCAITCPDKVISVFNFKDKK